MQASQAGSVALQELPLDATWTDTEVFVLTRPGTVTVYNRDDLRPTSRIDVNPGGRRFPRSFIINNDSVFVWSQPLSQILPVAGANAPVEPRRIGPERNTDWWVPWDPTPRGHGTAEVVGDTYLLEIREYALQQVGLTTLAHLIRMSRGDGSLDTLLTFEAPAYSIPRGEIFLCCTSFARRFAKHPHWATAADTLVAVLSNTSNAVSFVNLESGATREYVLPLSRPEITPRVIRRYEYRQARYLRGDRSRWYFLHLKWELFRDFNRLRTAYDAEGPYASQMLWDPRGLLWVRRFDPSQWPYGLGDEWVVVSPESGVLGTQRFASGALVHELGDGDEALVTRYGENGPRLAILRVPKRGQAGIP
jgi:hypothetical protein